MKKELKIEKELKFKCLICGGHNLVSTEISVEEYSVVSITDFPDAAVIEYSDKCEMVDHYKKHWSCKMCGDILKRVSTEIGLVNWIKKNCPQ